MAKSPPSRIHPVQTQRQHSHWFFQGSESKARLKAAECSGVLCQRWDLLVKSRWDSTCTISITPWEQISSTTTGGAESNARPQIVLTSAAREQFNFMISYTLRSIMWHFCVLVNTRQTQGRFRGRPNPGFQSTWRWECAAASLSYHTAPRYFITSYDVTFKLKLHMERCCSWGGLTPLKVIYQLDYRQQLLIRASHIWIYVPFVSHTQHALMTVIIVVVSL